MPHRVNCITTQTRSTTTYRFGGRTTRTRTTRSCGILDELSKALDNMISSCTGSRRNRNCS